MVGHLIENLCQLACVVLADGKDDGLAELAADRVAQGVFEKGLAEKLIGGRREEALLELAHAVGFFLVVATLVPDLYDEALI